MEKVCIIIDAANFYHLVLKKLGLQEVNFDYEKFVNFLANERKIIKNGKRFYVATVREKKDGYESKKAMSNQTITFSRLIRAGNWKIKTSKLKTREEVLRIDRRVVGYKKFLKSGIEKIEYTRSREKGIDVKIAVDLIMGAIDKKYDTAILISSDTDLVPAIDLVRLRLKKKIEYVGFSVPESKTHKATKPIPRMIEKTDIQRVLVEADIRAFVIKTVPNDKKN